MKFSYSWLNEFLKKDLPNPKKLSDLITKHVLEVEEIEKIEGDYILDIDVLPNRASDCLSHIGLARECSVLLEDKLNLPEIKLKEIKEETKDLIEVEIKKKEDCRRYTTRVVKDVEVGESPKWVKKKLEKCGVQPINNIVDATNLVMLEMGQPLHAFDLEKVKGNKIKVRKAKANEKVTTLDGENFELNNKSVVISDKEGILAIAGIKGGKKAEITNKTKNIVLESANFDPVSVRKTSQAINLRTEASTRFENKIDPNLTGKAVDRAAYLIQKVSNGKVTKGRVDNYEEKRKPKKIILKAQSIRDLLGIEIENKEIKKIFLKFGFKIEEKENKFEIEIPTYRLDLSIPQDLIEEVGRIFDYNNIPTPTTSPFFTPETLSETEVYYQKLRQFARSLSYKEITTNSLLSKIEADVLADKNIQISTLNPVSQENTTLRTHLYGGFLKSVRYNLNRNAENIRFFEIGHVFRKAGNENSTWIEGVQEHTRLLLGVCGQKKTTDWLGSKESYSVFDIKSDLESLIQYLSIDKRVVREAENNFILHYILDGKKIATLQQVDEDKLKRFDVEKDVFVAEVDLTTLFELGAGKADTTYSPVAKFPSFEFDAAFTVDKSIRAGELSSAIHKSADETLKSVSVFDVYEGENIGEEKKSIAFRLTFLDPNKTLTIKDVEPKVQKIVQSLENNFGAKLRS